MRKAYVKFGIVPPHWPSHETRRSEYVSQMMSYLSSLEDHFDSAWIMDHLAAPSRWGVTPLECSTTISYLSGAFRKLSFGSVVLCNSFRNPALVAKMGATLDFLTGGRFILGIGAGWLEEEYIQYGYDFPPPAVRIKQLEEGVQIIKRMWTEDEVTFEGKHFAVKNAHCEPKPDPPPPIMIGGGGEKLTLKVVARYADWWNTQIGKITYAHVDLATYKHKLDVLEHHCSQIGRDVNEIAKTAYGWVAIAETDKEALKIAQRGDLLVGAPETVKERMRAFVDVGVEYFILMFRDSPRLDGPLLFAEEVIPKFK